MTAEIVILNRACAVLAADSAVTVKGERVWATSSKVFNVKAGVPVGVMFFGAADFFGIPWEALIKEFRRSTAANEGDSVRALAEAFVAFLSAIPDREDVNEDEWIQRAILYEIDQLVAQTQSSSDGDGQLDRLASRFLKAMEDIPDLEFTEGLESNAVQAAVGEFLRIGHPKRQFSEATVEKVARCIVRRFECELPADFFTGIVFVGYSEGSYFPMSIQYTADGYWRGAARIWKVDETDLNSAAGPQSSVLAYAQHDVASAFMEGMVPEVRNYIGEALRTALELQAEEFIEQRVPAEEVTVERALARTRIDRAISEVESGLENFIHERVVSPITKVVTHLPKEEVAALAEALVEITSLRRRLDSPLQSVGGPVDVAVISKGDGFVWIKRRHYFDGSLNPGFFARP